MKKVLVTGVTGFLGSSLVARFLSEGCQVVALSRNDIAGTRTRDAVRQAAQGFGFKLTSSMLAQLSVLDIDYTNLTALQANPLFQNVDEAWHSAAEMTYNPRKLDLAIRQNLNATYSLYKLLEAHTACRRFYYISTAYTAGMASGEVAEELHLSPSLLNVYQASKWSAEMSLAQAHQQGRLPVTIFRPSIVVGHSENGWSGSTLFGFYTFVKSMQFTQHIGSPSLKLNILPEAEINMIPIDWVCRYAFELSSRNDPRPDFEVFHAAASKSLTCREICDMTGDLFDIKVHIEKPTRLIDRVIDDRFQKNAPFARKSWTFGMTRLEKALEGNFEPFVMNPRILKRLVQVFVQNHNQGFEPTDSRQRIQLASLRLEMQRERIKLQIQTLPRNLWARLG